jgi:ribonuclease E
MKEALKNDRARIQVGRISSFGLMEMSRQRLRTGVLEASTKPCPHCDGTGLMRTAASAGLSALRIIEDEAARGRGEKICLRAGKEAAVYVLNKKRTELAEIEERYGVSIDIIIDESFEGARMTVESAGPRPIARPRPQEIAPVEEDLDEAEALLEDEDEGDEEEETSETSTSERSEDQGGERHGRRRRRRRRGGRGRRREGEHAGAEDEGAHTDGEGATESADAGADSQPIAAVSEAETEAEGSAPTKRRRRRRGRQTDASETAEQASPEAVEPDSSPMIKRPIDEEAPITETQPTAEPQPKRRRSNKAVAEAEVAVVEPAPAEAPPAETTNDAAPPKPARKRRSKAAVAAEPEQAPAAEPVAVPAANNDVSDEENGEEPRRGWWQRTFG